MSQGLETWGADVEKIASSIPLGRLGNEVRLSFLVPHISLVCSSSFLSLLQDDMAGACIYFASKAGSWCTGVILNVDGGTVGALQIPLSSL